MLTERKAKMKMNGNSRLMQFKAKKLIILNSSLIKIS